jgi:tetratricopeptide (TPR) repeat protein
VSTVTVLAALSAWSCGTFVPQIPRIPLEGSDAEVRDAVLTARRQAVAHPKNGAATGRLGMLLEAHELYPLAVLAYRRAIRLEPKEFAWHYYLALSLQKASQPEQALEAISAALRIRSSYTPAVLKHAELLFKLGRFQESSTVLEALLPQDPNSATTLYALARVRYAQQDLSAAEDLYRRALQAYPSFGAAYYGLGLTEKRLGHSAESAKNFALAESHTGDSPSAEDPLSNQILDLATGLFNRFRQANQMLHQGQFEESSRLFQEILKRNPENLDCMLNLLYLARFTDPGEDVETLYARALRIDPQIPQLYMYYGTARAGQGKVDAAVTALNKAIELKPDYAEAHFVLGDVLERQNQAAPAIEHYRLALAAQPSYRPAQLQLGQLLVNLGRGREAIPALLPALQFDDANTPFVMVLLAEAYANSGDLEKAREYLKQARSAALKTGPPDLVQRIEQGMKQLGSRPC